MSDSQYLVMEQLRVGLHVHLDLKWFEHPFAFSHFRIKSVEQIEIIRGLGLRKVRYSPELSEGSLPQPLATLAEPSIPVQSPCSVELDMSPTMLAKRALVEQMRLRRLEAQRVENAFASTAKAIREIEKHLFRKPAEAMQQAGKLISQIVDSLLSAPELAIHVMGEQTGAGDDLYFHSLNVTMLSMMMARDLELPAEVVRVMGMGALLHDLGLKDVPDKILMKTEALTHAERNFYELHCQYGVVAGQRLLLPQAVLAIIREHHELFDGTGFPEKRKGESTSLLSRIVAIANYYDELCNPAALADSLTPHEALSLMFAKLRGKFDPKILQVFIRSLGVYPPGTIVQLSNGAIGLVATVNTARPMKPVVVVYDADVPKEDAILIDMEGEVDVTIAKAIRPAQVPREVLSYLSPRKRVSYYFDATSAQPATGNP